MGGFSYLVIEYENEDIVRLYRDIKVSELPIVDRYSTGSSINKKGISEAFLYKVFIEKNDEDKEKKQISLEDVDKRLMTIDDFLK